MSYLNGIQQQRAEEIERQSGWDCGRHEDTVLTEQEQIGRASCRERV